MEELSSSASKAEIWKFGRKSKSRTDYPVASFRKMAVSVCKLANTNSGHKMAVQLKRVKTCACVINTTEKNNGAKTSASQSPNSVTGHQRSLLQWIGITYPAE